MSIGRPVDVPRMIRSVLFFGAQCQFADVVLQALRAADFDIAARVIPGHTGASSPYTEIGAPTSRHAIGRLPMAGSSQPGDGAGSGNPHLTIMLHDRHSAAAAEYLTSFNADIAVVCCYPARLPTSLMATARSGGVNIHPSLLPRYRGPEPIFWIFRNGELESGVTIHRVDADLDTGAILRQERLSVPIGTPGDTLWNRSASLSATLLLDLLQHASPVEMLESGSPQHHSGASYYSWPAPSDLIVRPESWESWRVFHFCRGVLPLGYVPVLERDGEQRTIISAVDYVDQNDQSANTPDWLSCLRGSVRLRLGPIIGH